MFSKISNSQTINSLSNDTINNWNSLLITDVSDTSKIQISKFDSLKNFILSIENISNTKSDSLVAEVKNDTLKKLEDSKPPIKKPTFSWDSLLITDISDTSIIQVSKFDSLKNFILSVDNISNIKSDSIVAEVKNDILIKPIVSEAPSNKSAGTCDSTLLYILQQDSSFECDTSKTNKIATNNDSLTLKKPLSKKEIQKRKIVCAMTAFPFPLGMMGAHRVMLGCKPWVPVVYMATFGGCFGILPFIDFCAIVISKDLTEYENNPQIFMWVK